MESLWVPLDRGFRDGTTSLSRDGVRLTSPSLLKIRGVGGVTPTTTRSVYGIPYERPE